MGFTWWIQKLAEQLPSQSRDGADVQVDTELQNRSNLLQGDIKRQYVVGRLTCSLH